MYLERSPRYPVDISAVLAAGTRHTTAGIHDLSESGLFVMSQLDLQPGTRLKVRPLGAAVLPEMDAEVVRRSTRDGKTFGLGLRFVRLSARHRLALQDYCQGKTPRRDVPFTPNEDTAPVLVWSENEGISHPLKMKRIEFGDKSAEEVTQVVPRVVAARKSNEHLRIIAGTILLLSLALVWQAIDTQSRMERQRIRNVAAFSPASTSTLVPVTGTLSDTMNVAHSIDTRALRGTKKSAVMVANTIQNLATEPVQIQYVRTQLYVETKVKKNGRRTAVWKPVFDELVRHPEADVAAFSTQLKTMLDESTLAPHLPTELSDGQETTTSAAAIVKTSKKRRLQVTTEVGFSGSGGQLETVVRTSVMPMR